MDYRNKLKIVFAVGLILSSKLLIAAATGESQVRENEWEQAIKKFEAWDEKNSFEKDGVLFIGSSSIRWWKTANLFPELPVINRGFGGAQISDINFFARRIVIPYKPRIIVFYAGACDIMIHGKNSETVFQDFVKFTEFVRKKLPRTRIIFMSIKPGPAIWEHSTVCNKTNSLIKEYCDKKNHLFYADVATGMLDKNGKPDKEYYLKDGIHLNSQGGVRWAELLRPTLDKALEK